MQYKHLFFDIDRTLWDYDENSRQVIFDMYKHFEFNKYGFTEIEFFDMFNYYNQLMWVKFRKGEIRKSTLRVERFRLTLRKLGITDNIREMANTLSVQYFEITPTKTNIFPGVVETLNYLKPKYNLHIITNGFDEVQYKKLENCGLQHYWQRVVTCDNSGYQKPHKKIFQYALSGVHAKKEESLMIGDDWEVDIVGAQNFGIDQVFFNPLAIKHAGKATFEIFKFNELCGFL